MTRRVPSLALRKIRLTAGIIVQTVGPVYCAAGRLRLFTQPDPSSDDHDFQSPTS